MIGAALAGVVKSPLARKAIVIGAWIAGGVIVLRLAARSIKKIRKQAKGIYVDQQEKQLIQMAFQAIDANPAYSEEEKSRLKAAVLRNYDIDPKSEIAKTVFGFLVPGAFFFAPPEWLKNIFKRRDG